MNVEEVHILLVEDDPNDAFLILRTLREKKLAKNIIHVSDGQEALDYLNAEGKYSGRDVLNLPKIILLDLKMPKLDGHQVLASIRACEGTKLVPVVILTSSAEQSDISLSYKLGANSFIVKPVDFDKFTENINQLGLYWLALNKTPRTQ